MTEAKTNVMVVVGTRPEAVKMAPVITALRQADDFACCVLSTGQHREILRQSLGFFGIVPDHDLDIMTANQTLAGVTSACLQGVEMVLRRERPDIVLVQGDTTTVLATSLACFYGGVPVGHVEAGLRTDDKLAPYPEEMNRRVASVIADLHFAPTAWARENLLREGIPAGQVFVTGNTVVDALLAIGGGETGASTGEPDLDRFLERTQRLILVTAHRRESFGEPFAEMCAALRDVAADERVGIVYPVHPNPNVREVVHATLAGHPRIKLVEPLTYPLFVSLMKRSYLVLTDSGGVQEEAPTFARPVLIMRDTTERPEGVEAGVARLVGTNRDSIVGAVRTLLDDPAAYGAMAQGVNPFGDGRAAQRIVEIIRERFNR